MSRTNMPTMLWDYCCQYTVGLRNRLARPLPQLHSRTPHDMITSNTPDILEYLEFMWFEPIWYYEPRVFPEENKPLTYWLGIAHRVGQAMCYWILPSTGVPIARTTLQRIPKEERQTNHIISKLEELRRSVDENIHIDGPNQGHLQLYREDVKDVITDLAGDEPLEPQAIMQDQDVIETDVYNELLLTDPILSHDGKLARATILGRKHDPNGNLIGHYHPNPLLNTWVYLASFPDGHIAEYSANLITEALYNNIAEDGTDQLLFDSIIGHENVQVDNEKFGATVMIACEYQTSSILPPMVIFTGVYCAKLMTQWAKYSKGMLVDCFLAKILFSVDCFY